MKIISAVPDYGCATSGSEGRDFLAGSKLNMQIGTVDSSGGPVIEPFWYCYDKSTGKIYTETGKDSKKVRNTRKRTSSTLTSTTELPRTKASRAGRKSLKTSAGACRWQKR